MCRSPTTWGAVMPRLTAAWGITVAHGDIADRFASTPPHPATGEASTQSWPREHPVQRKATKE